MIEDLQVSSSESEMIREIIGWMDQLTTDTALSAIEWIKWPSIVPNDVEYIECQKEICVLKKKNNKILHKYF